MYSAQDVANFVLQTHRSFGCPVNNFKLQQILYFVQANFLTMHNRPCFSDNIEAWDIGPVVPSVYERYKGYGSNAIPKEGYSNAPELSHVDKYLIEGIVTTCMNYSAEALSEITRNQAPWLNSYFPQRKNVIPKNSFQPFPASVAV